MSTGNLTLTVRGIDVEVAFKDIKNLHIGVYPPSGRVRVAAPRRLDEDRVRLAVIQRLPWIKRQRQQFRDASRQSEREMTSGETHHVWGSPLRLRVIERPGRAHIETDHDRLLLYVPAGTDHEARRRLLDRWYRSQLRQAILPMISYWEPIIGCAVTHWGIRRMKTKWGSCIPESGRIWLNLELAKKHPHCLEYVIVHEMAHFQEDNHGERFTKLMDSLMSDWRSRRDTLNASPLAAEDWQ
jgi:predicted metal-dependent hydrolase